MGCLGLLCPSDIFLPCYFWGQPFLCKGFSCLYCVSFSICCSWISTLHLPVIPLSVNEPSPCDCYHTLLQGLHEGVLEADLCCAWLILHHVFWELLKEANELKLREENIFFCD